MQISGGQLFSKLDMLQAYQQRTVDGDGILVVNAPRELFRYTRLLYGVSVAPVIFPCVMDWILQELLVASML